MRCVFVGGHWTVQTRTVPLRSGNDRLKPAVPPEVERSCHANKQIGINAFSDFLIRSYIPASPFVVTIPRRNSIEPSVMRSATLAYAYRKLMVDQRFVCSVSCDEALSEWFVVFWTF